MKTKIILTLSLALAAGLAFQNCSKVTLQRDLTEEKLEAPSLTVRASYCPDVEAMPAEAAKYVFVIDMSSSNIGDWDTDPKVGDVIPPSYWDRTKATDFNGGRFKAVQSFLDTCGNQAAAQFAIIGFSYSAGTIVGTGATRALSCNNVQFGTAANAISELHTLAQVQEDEKPWFLQWQRSLGKYLTDPNFPPIMNVTSYRSAMACTESVIVSDLTQHTVNTTDNYHIFFISDGSPVDAEAITGCNRPGWTAQEKSDCQMQATISASSYMRQAAFAKGKDLRIHTIYYGRSSTPIHLDALAKDGGTQTTMKLDSFQTDQNVLCSLVLGQQSVELRPDSLAVVNLTSVRKHGVLHADSDMDGLTDDEEAALGYGPTNPRSAVDGVLDGICQRLGSYTACQAKRANIVCMPALFNAAGLTDCDVRMLGLDSLLSTPDWGVDSDGDGVPDYIEIVKGSDPAVSDMGGDPDGDGVSTLQEMERGTDPFFADQGIPEYKLNNFTVSFLPLGDVNTCSYGSWKATVSRLQSTPTLDVNKMPANLSGSNHIANEQVLMFFYRLTPQNAPAPTSQFFWSTTRVLVTVDPVAPKVESISDPDLIKSDFLRIGAVGL